jgi:glucosamine--fructose-6-phosphate aminotransferase (isomerizing)
VRPAQKTSKAATGRRTQSGGTAVAGCAAATLAMVASEMGADSLTPDALALVPGSVRNAIEASGVEGVPVPQRALVLVGAGPASITASEGAVKSREAARILAEGFDAEYFLHGGAVPLGGHDHVVALTTPDEDGFVAALATTAEGAGIGVTRLAEPAPLPPLLAQIPMTARLQLLALRLATARGQDPDKVVVGRWDDPQLWSIGSPRA